jgi:hypothetical protein
VTVERENALGLRILELEAALRRAQADTIDPTLSRTHAKLRAVVHRNAELADLVAYLTAQVEDLTARLEAAILTSITLEGECAECPEDGFHDAWPYRDWIRKAADDD